MAQSIERFGDVLTSEVAQSIEKSGVLSSEVFESGIVSIQQQFPEGWGHGHSKEDSILDDSSSNPRSNERVVRQLDRVRHSRVQDETVALLAITVATVWCADKQWQLV